MSAINFRSLRVKLFLFTLFSAVVSVAVYFVSLPVSNRIHYEIYCSENRIKTRAEDYIFDFSVNTAFDKMSVSSPESIQPWCDDNRGVCVIIKLSESESVYIDSDNIFYIDTYFAPQGVSYTAKFTDGTYPVTFVENIDVLFADRLPIIPLILSVAVFSVMTLFGFRRYTRKIDALNESVSRICGGNLSVPVAVGGDDELSLLAGGIDKMRRIQIKYRDSKQHAVDMNTELLTSISHDIRTPLTALIGFAELMSDDPSLAPRYADKCLDKAYRLKDLTDTLFKYFLVYGEREVKPTFKEHSANELFSELLTGHVEYLRSHGYNVTYTFDVPSCKISTDILLINRLLDNLFSNISKYAREDGVYVGAAVVGKKLGIHFQNCIDISINQTESTKIGLKTCEKIVAALGGKMVSQEKHDIYNTDLYFDVIC